MEDKKPGLLLDKSGMTASEATKQEFSYRWTKTESTSGLKSRPERQIFVRATIKLFSVEKAIKQLHMERVIVEIIEVQIWIPNFSSQNHQEEASFFTSRAQNPWQKFFRPSEEQSWVP